MSTSGLSPYNKSGSAVAEQETRPRKTIRNNINARTPNAKDGFTD